MGLEITGLALWLVMMLPFLLLAIAALVYARGARSAEREISSIDAAGEHGVGDEGSGPALPVAQSAAISADELPPARLSPHDGVPRRAGSPTGMSGTPMSANAPAAAGASSKASQAGAIRSPANTAPVPAAAAPQRPAVAMPQVAPSQPPAPIAKPSQPVAAPMAPPPVAAPVVAPPAAAPSSGGQAADGPAEAGADAPTEASADAPTEAGAEPPPPPPPPRIDYAGMVAAAEAIDDTQQLPTLYIALARQQREDGLPMRQTADVLRKSIRLAATHGQHMAHALARIELGDLEGAAGDMTTACEHWQIARSLFHDMKLAKELAATDVRMRRAGCPTDWVLNDF